MILTDKEMQTAIGFCTDQMVAYRKVEAAVLKKLSEQEPVAWLRTDGHCCLWYYRPDEDHHEGSVPLYTHPAPPEAK